MRTPQEAPQSLDFDDETFLRPPPCDAQHGLHLSGCQSPEKNDGPSETLLEFHIHPWRLLIASIVLSSLLVVITIALEQGFELATIAPGESLSWSLLRSSNISEQIDDLNSYSGNVASALGALWTFALQLIVYVFVLALIPGLMIDNSSVWAKLALLAITGGVGWLATQGFVATNVQLKPMETIPVLSFADLNGFDGDLMNTFQNFTPFVGNAIANPQPSTSTLLRTAIAGAYPRERVACNVFDEGDHDVSVSYGFSSSDWLRYVMPSGSTDTATLALVTNTSWLASSELPISQTNATSLAIFALEMSESFFSVHATVNVTRYESLWSEYGNQPMEETDAFLGAMQQLVRSTFSDQKNYFQHFSTEDSTVEFTQTHLSDKITFDAVTIEIPLKRNFFSRTLTTALSNSSSDASGNTLTYTSNPVDVADGEDAIYELAVWEDCSPNGCMLTGGLDEVNSKGVVTYPDSQVLAVRICLDSNGNEDPLETIGDCRYGRSLDSFLVFSVASRIEGDSMTIDSEESINTRVRELEDTKDNESEEDTDAQFRELDDEDESRGQFSDCGALMGHDFRVLAFSDINFDDDSTTGSSNFSNPKNEIPGGDPTTQAPSTGTTTNGITVTTDTAAPRATTVTPTTTAPATTTTQHPSSTTKTPDVTTKTPAATTQTPETTTQTPVAMTTAPDTITQTPAATTRTPQTTSQPSAETPSPSSQSASNGQISSASSSGAASSSTSSVTTGIAPKGSSVADSTSANATSAQTSKAYSLSASAMTELASALTRKAYLKNTRKIYTITVGRLNWKLEDLSERFGARCNVTYNHDCQGLAFELTDSPQQLVVGRQYLPLANLRDFSGSSYLWTPLAKIKRDSGFGGDFAFKAAFTDSNWPEDLNGTACKSSREEYIMSSLDNHMYTQHSFQPAYTASVMWLFQYGTANDIVNIGENSQSLAFSSNIIRSGVIMSTPSYSSYFTYGACGLLIILSLVVLLMACRRHRVRPERTVLTRTVAEVLLKENQYPPVFVKCYVHPPRQDDIIVDADSMFVMLSDTMQPLHTHALLGLELRGNEHPADHQWLSDRPTEYIGNPSSV